MRGSFQRRDVAGGPIATGLASIRLVNLVKDIHQGTWLVLLRNSADLLQTRRLAKGAQEGAALAARAAKADPFAQNDGPGEKTGKREQSEDGESDRPAGPQHLQNRVRWSVGRHRHALIIALKEQENREEKRMNCHLRLLEQIFHSCVPSMFPAEQLF